MADVEEGQHNLLTSKWGPLPVWAWGAILLGLAWAYAKYKSSKATAATDTSATDTTGTSDSSSETDATAPQFIIENNMPGGGTATTSGASAPVTTPTQPLPVTTPPTLTAAPPAKVSAPVAVVKPPAKPAPVKATPKKPAPVKAPAKKPIAYKVVHGDNLSTIAAKYHTTAAKLFTYNTTPGVRPAATIAELKKRGPNLIYAGETIYIPQ